MKTIQQVIKELDSTELEERYRRQYPLNIYSLEDCDALTIGAFNSYESQRFQEFLDKIKNIEPVKDEVGQGILVAHKSDAFSVSTGIDVDLIFMDDLMKKDDLSKIERYECEFMPHKVSMSFLVADTEFNRRNLMDLVVQFLFEISYYGYEQTGLKKALEEARDAFREAQECKKRIEEEIAVPYDMHSVPEEKVITREEELHEQYREAGRKYTAYCREREYEIIKNQLIENKNL